MTTIVVNNAKEFVLNLVRNPHARCEVATNEAGEKVIHIIPSGISGKVGIFFNNPVKALFKAGELHDEQAYAVAEQLAQWGRYKDTEFTGFGKHHLLKTGSQNILIDLIKHEVGDDKAAQAVALTKLRKWELRAWAHDKGLEANATVLDAVRANEATGSAQSLNIVPADVKNYPELAKVAGKRIFRNFNDADLLILRNHVPTQVIARDFGADVEEGFVRVDTKPVPGTLVSVETSITNDPVNDILPQEPEPESARTLALRRQAAKAPNPFDDVKPLALEVLHTPATPVAQHQYLNAVLRAPNPFDNPEPQKPVQTHEQIIAAQLAVFYKSAPIAETAYANFAQQFAQEAEWGNSMYIQQNDHGRDSVEKLLAAAQAEHDVQGELYAQTIQNAAQSHVTPPQEILNGMLADIQAFEKRTIELKEILNSFSSVSGKRWHDTVLTLEDASAKVAKEVDVVNAQPEGYAINFNKHMRRMALADMEIDPAVDPALATAQYQARIRHNTIIGLYALILKEGTPVVVNSEYDYHQRFVSPVTAKEMLRKIVQTTGRTLSDLNHSIQSQTSELNANAVHYQRIGKIESPGERRVALNAKQLKPLDEVVRSLSADLINKAQYAGLSEGASALIRAIEQGDDALATLIRKEAQITLNHPGVRGAR